MTETNVATLPVTTPAPRREVRVVNDPIPVLDTARFEQMLRIAQVMSRCIALPEALTKMKEGDNLIWLSEQAISANCFMVVNQAVRWGMDPFAVGQCVSIVRGKLCYVGKLIAAVINAKLGYDLEYEFNGEGDEMSVVVSAALDGKPVVDSKGRPKDVFGTVKDWKTTGTGSPWSSKANYPRMLRYRGAREWCRIYAPALMLGVYSDDEMEENSRRFQSARDVTAAAGGNSYSEQPALSAPPLRAPPPPPDDKAKAEPEKAAPPAPPAPARAMTPSEKASMERATVELDREIEGLLAERPAPPAQAEQPAEQPAAGKAPEPEAPRPSQPPLRAPPPPDEDVAQQPAQPAMPDAKLGGDAFLAWVRQKVAMCKTADDVMLTWTDDIYEHVPGNLHGAANEIMQMRLKELGSKP